MVLWCLKRSTQREELGVRPGVGTEEVDWGGLVGLVV